MHLRWDPSPLSLLEVAVTLEIVEPPAVDELYFWALQASFLDGGRHIGAAHLGLQWYSPHPGGTAVNWGGYRDGAGEVEGEQSTLPSATRQSEHARLRVAAAHAVPVANQRRRRRMVDRLGDRSHHARRRPSCAGSMAAGTRLANPMVWSEVFARCDDPSVVVRWSDLSPRPVRLLPSYQTHEDGGCANTASRRDGDAYVQITNADRKG